jgi:glycosyltransferase involved in cell wall biosynthesis
MPGSAPVLSLIVSTKGRKRELEKLLCSLERQTWRDFELIVIEQNPEPILAYIVERGWKFPVIYRHTAGEQGASRGRNHGMKLSRAEFLLFPDDDCWYPEAFLECAVKQLRESGLDALTGRPTSEDGKPINGRFETRAQWIDRTNVWTTQIEWIAFWRRDLFAKIGGFDEMIGIGAPTPWQSAEGQDLMLRALGVGARCRYDPSLTGHDAGVDRNRADAALISKARAYGRGMGFVMRKHRLGLALPSYYVMRAVAGAMFAAVRAQLPLAKFHTATAVGRMEGLLRLC